MRQKDTRFSELLNRLRIGQCTDDDEAILMTRIIKVDKENEQYPANVLHTFATNRECDEHNNFSLHRLGTKVYQINAIDSKLDRLTKSVIVEKLPLKQSDTGGLRETVSIADGAHVMITCNLDVSDGLSNGVIESVKGVIEKHDKVLSLHIYFSNMSVGRRARNQNPFRDKYPHCVEITRHQSISSSTRLCLHNT